MKIKVTDKGDETFFEETTITINIQDVNDNAPKFAEEVYAIDITEDPSNAINGISTLLTVKATDDDISDEFGEKSLRFSFNPQTTDLDIDEETGEITHNPTNNPFDAESPEKEKEYRIEVRDCQSGCVSLTDYTTLKVKILNINDNSPQPEEVCKRSFKNDATFTDDIVLELGATDADDDTVKFSLDQNQNDPDFPFRVDENDGTIFIDSNKIQEVETSFLFKITLEDDGQPSSLSTDVECNMTVTDVNDKQPEFTFPETEEKNYWIDVESNVGVPLNLLDGTPVVLHAADLDVNSCFKKIGYEYQGTIKEEYKEYFG